MTSPSCILPRLLSKPSTIVQVDEEKVEQYEELQSTDEIEEFIPSYLIWKNILEESANKCKQIEEYLEAQAPLKLQTQKCNELKYLETEIFPYLMPIMSNILLAAREMECLKHQKSLFNGIDFLAQQLWNLNPRYPNRAIEQKNIYLMDWAVESLKKKPRSIIPKSWIWNNEQAAIKIQAYYRGHLVRKDPEVQEMRQFWKLLKIEKEEKEALKKILNPYYR